MSRNRKVMPPNIYCWFLLLLLPLSCAAPVEAPPPPEPEPFKMLFLVADGIGDIHFKMKTLMEAEGVQVTVAGLKRVSSSCPNKEPRPVTSDQLISEIVDLSAYQGIFVASGAQHHILSRHQEALGLLAAAHAQGLVISSICVGNVVLARAGLVQGRKVVSQPYVDPVTLEEGGIPVPDTQVVVDGNLITAGAGGGPRGGGYIHAPATALCRALLQAMEKNRSLH